jgi:hypothetical protein
MDKCIEGTSFTYSHDNHKAYYKADLGDLSGFKIYLYGMNTCLNCDRYDENDYGKGHKMFLPQLAYNAHTDKSGCVNICMMHHPLEKIANRSAIEGVLNKKFQVQIFGHLHRPASKVDTSIHIQSGALQPPIDESNAGDSYFSVYNIVELEIEPNSVLIVRLFVERYNSDTDKFEDLTSESQEFKINLLKHKSRWSGQNKTSKDEPENLPEGISARQIMLSFLRSSSRDRLIEEMWEYNNQKSLHDNCIDFLKKMEKDKRLTELWNRLSK